MRNSYLVLRKRVFYLEKMWGFFNKFINEEWILSGIGIMRTNMYFLLDTY